jgi:hypothetical protein
MPESVRLTVDLPHAMAKAPVWFYRLPARPGDTGTPGFSADILHLVFSLPCMIRVNKAVL